MCECWRSGCEQGAEVGFEALLGDDLGGVELRALKDVFFQLLYPGEYGGRMLGWET